MYTLPLRAWHCLCTHTHTHTHTHAHTHTHTRTENAQVDANDFKDDGANTLHADVDTRKCGFTGQPFYFAQVC